MAYAQRQEFSVGCFNGERAKEETGWEEGIEILGKLDLIEDAVGREARTEASHELVGIDWIDAVLAKRPKLANSTRKEARRHEEQQAPPCSTQFS